jgi:hypothetical protein
MTQATHTQGPWRIVTDGISHWIEIQPNKIALIHAKKTDRDLIAAAPDLLSALEQLLSLTELHIAERSKTPEEEDTFLACHHITQARTTIAKAKGN